MRSLKIIPAIFVLLMMVSCNNSEEQNFTVDEISGVIKRKVNYPKLENKTPILKRIKLESLIITFELNCARRPMGKIGIQESRFSEEFKRAKVFVNKSREY